MEIEIEEFTFLKESWLEDKRFLVFQNSKGELRAVEAHIVSVDDLTAGTKLKAKVSRKGCSGREIHEVYSDN